MKNVKLVTQFGEHLPGRILRVDSGLADNLLAQRIAITSSEADGYHDVIEATIEEVVEEVVADVLKAKPAPKRVAKRKK